MIIILIILSGTSKKIIHLSLNYRPGIGKSGLPLKKFFNTSGSLYKSLQLKDKLPGMTDDEMYSILASDGMLVKRPLIITKNKVLIGFKEKEWEEKLFGDTL